jgi:hypothetical protein
MFKFLKKTRKYGWMSLGGILLCMTGMLINICVMDIYRIQKFLPSNSYQVFMKQKLTT